MKKKLHAVPLDVQPGAPLVFAIDCPLGDLLRVDAVVVPAGVVPAGVVSAQNKQRGKMAPIMTFLVDEDAPLVKRVIVLIPYGGWIDEATQRVIGSFLNPLDGSPIAVFEVDYNPATMKTDEPAPIDVPSGKLADVLPFVTDATVPAEIAPLVTEAAP